MSVSVAVSSSPSLSNPPKAAAELLESVVKALGGSPRALILFSPYHGVDHSSLLKELADRSNDTPLIGGTNYGSILGTDCRDRELVLWALGGDVQASVGTGRNLARDAKEAGRACARGALSAGRKDAKLFVLIHEPQAGSPPELAEGALEELGEIPMIGGGSGTGFVMEQNPLSKQFAGRTALAGAAAGLLLRGDFQVSCGFSHGGRPIGKPWTLTKTRRNILVEIDGKPALDALEEALDAPFSRSCMSFITIGCALLEPGMKESVQYGLWGASPAERALFCGTPLPEGARYQFIRIDSENLLADQKLAAARALKALGRPASGALVFDCYGRRLHLDPRGLLKAELAAIAAAFGGIPTAGMYSGSELAVVDAGLKSAGSRYGHGCSSFAVLG